MISGSDAVDDTREWHTSEKQAKDESNFFFDAVIRGGERVESVNTGSCTRALAPIQRSCCCTFMRFLSEPMARLRIPAVTCSGPTLEPSRAGLLTRRTVGLTKQVFTARGSSFALLLLLLLWIVVSWHRSTDDKFKPCPLEEVGEKAPVNEIPWLIDRLW